MEEAESFANYFIEIQLSVNFWIGDLARYSERTWPSTHPQVWPAGTSDKLLARPAGVCNAYPKEEDRQIEATYSQYMQNSSQPDRLARLEAIVEKGQTSDESRKADQGERADAKQSWLLAIDVNYYLHKWYHSGSGVESAMLLTQWIQRTANRLKEKGLTDCACCFDAPNNFRKVLTADWEDKYKGNRGPKDPELVQQLQLVRSLLEGDGFACFSMDGYEGDDCLASCAKQFKGKVAILAKDKDLKQCLDSDRVVMLEDVTWEEDEHSGEMLPEYHWYTEKPHERLKCRNLLEDTGLTPKQFPELQSLMGDSTDCIKGAPGIGETGALNLIREFGTAAACIKAAHNKDPRLMEMKRGAIMAKGLLELEPILDTMMRLVKLVDNLEISIATRI